MKTTKYAGTQTEKNLEAAFAVPTIEYLSSCGLPHLLCYVWKE